MTSKPISKALSSSIVAACLFAQPGFKANAELPAKVSAQLDEFLAETGFAPIKVEKTAKTNHHVNKRWKAWLDKSIFDPCRERVRKSHPDLAARVDELLTLTAEKRLRHPDRPRPMMENQKKVFDLAEQVAAMKIDDPVVGLCVTLGRRLTLVSQVENVRMLDDAVKTTDSTLVRYLIANERFDEGATAKAAMELLADELAFQPEDEDLILAMLQPRIRRMKDAKLVSEIVHAPRWSEWARLTLQGAIEVRKAWAERGSGYAHTVTPQGWEGFGKHLDLARAALVKAWKLRPDLPYAASQMIEVTMGGGPGGDGSLRDWFDRAVAARFDHMEAYDAFIWALLPRWGGTHEQIIACGLACARTRRFDTDVPAYFANALLSIKADGLREWKELYANPLVREVLLEAIAAYVGEPSQSGVEPGNRWRLILYAYVCGDLETASTKLDGVSTLVGSAQGEASDFDLDEKTIRLDLALHKRGVLAAYKEGQEMYDKGDLAGARMILEKILAAVPAEEIPGAVERLDAIGFEEELANGEWVKLKMLPGLKGWRPNPQFKGTPEGDLEGTPTTFPIRKSGRTGANLEMRGEFTLDEGKVPAANFMLEFNCSFSPKRPTALGAGVFTGPDGKSIFGSLFAGNIPAGTSVAIPMEGKFSFHITLRDGKVTFVLNDKLVCSEVVPRFAGESGSLFPIQENAGIGFGFSWRELRRDSFVRVSSLEVRKLKAK